MILVGALLLIGAGLLFRRYRIESRQLRQVATAVAGADLGCPALVVERLNQWVYHNQGFAKNPHYFLSPRLGPTPLQVLAGGGDCADKSRLLAAMLDELGIPGTLVMLYSPDYGEPTHTVVEARLPGFRAVADPVFNIVFPDGQGGLLGVAQLRARHDLFAARLRTLTAERGPQAKVAYYETESESYRWPRTINWERLAITSAIAAALRWFIPHPELLARPRVLGEPVWLVSLVLAAGGGLCLALGLILAR